MKWLWCMLCFSLSACSCCSDGCHREATIGEKLMRQDAAIRKQAYDLEIRR